ncbi:hypothetical protein [Burkholderia gladioli]|uniref:hypothetical protein n=1 Tax=Burkholderia gladioli TaxID=28095 RepID=UPI001640D0D7|nr:hypothetical protein [Burkholderia gladioli]
MMMAPISPATPLSVERQRHDPPGIGDFRHRADDAAAAAPPVSLETNMIASLAIGIVLIGWLLFSGTQPMQFTSRVSRIPDFPQSIKSTHRSPVKIVNYFFTRLALIHQILGKRMRNR